MTIQRHSVVSFHYTLRDAGGEELETSRDGDPSLYLHGAGNLLPGLARALGVEGVSLAVIAIAAATPTATNGYILARQLGGDAPFMANLIATQTVLAAVTMPLVLWAFNLL